MRGVTQEARGSVYYLRGKAEVETVEMLLRADEIDYDQEKGYAEARGHVVFDHYAGGEHLEADKVEYDLKSEVGKYYNVRGSSPATLEARPGVLTTTSPFSFEAKWAERLSNRYILHDGFITNCRLPKPWWILTGSTFDVVPGRRAIARNAVFKLRKVPLFYTPAFYKALNRAPRKSGFLTPNFGNSSRRGTMYGGGYYWAINRSYDAMYRAQLFTQRGFAHNVDFRGKPSETTDFNFILYGVNDRGQLRDDGQRDPSQGGFLMTFDGRSQLPMGFSARADIKYLSSFEFRQAFTESFYEAISSEVHSRGFLTKHWSTFALNLVGTRVENFQSTRENDKVSLRKLPSLEFRSREREIRSSDNFPVWISLDSSASFLRRRQLDFETDQFVNRLDFEPRVSTAMRWKDIHLVPSFSVRGTRYGTSYGPNGRPAVLTQGVQLDSGLFRTSRQFSLELILPSIQRVFENPPKAFGGKLKHVIETRAAYRDVSGVENFSRLIRFDETELLSNTQELEVSVANRFYTKRSNGQVDEVLSWTVAQQRYFDPTFGGALVQDTRNVLLSSARLTGYSFLDGRRSYSPIVSSLRGNLVRGLGLEWRADYDPLRGHFVNSSVNLNANISTEYFISLAHSQVRSSPFLIPPANQFSGMMRFGQENRRGWSAGFFAIYDYRQEVMQFAQTQVTYNTDCCGWSVQYRRFGTRNENQFRVAFAVANIGSFGTLKRQERMF